MAVNDPVIVWDVEKLLFELITASVDDAGIDVPLIVVVTPEDLPIVIVGVFVVPINNDPTVPVAVPASIIMLPEFEVVPVALPVLIDIAFEFVEVAAVGDVPNTPDEFTFNNTFPEVSCHCVRSLFWDVVPFIVKGTAPDWFEATTIGLPLLDPPELYAYMVAFELFPIIELT